MSRRLVVSSAARPLPVAIFYEDIASADRALRSVREALRRRHDPRPIQPVLWNVQLFHEEQWLRLAAADAVAAELCLISLGHAHGMSDSPAAWLRELAACASDKWITLAPFEAVGDHHLALPRAG